MSAYVLTVLCIAALAVIGLAWTFPPAVRWRRCRAVWRQAESMCKATANRRDRDGRRLM